MFKNPLSNQIAVKTYKKEHRFLPNANPAPPKSALI
jgi:hypothetical protein